MAKMFPKRIEIDEDDFFNKSSAEKGIYELFEKSLPDDIFGFYSVRWLLKKMNHRLGNQSNGEADFILAHPKFGALILEVKGGRVEYDGRTGSWYSKDRHGKLHNIKNPFKQAETNRYALIEKMKEMPSAQKIFLPASHGVIFPDVSEFKGSLPADVVPEILIGSQDLKNIGESIQKMFEFWAKKSQSSRDFDPRGFKLLENLLAPKLSIIKPLSEQISDYESEVLKLSKKQFKLMNSLKKNRRLAVSGPAGCGKTILALERAKELSREGMKVLLTCFNIPLANYLKSIAESDENLFILNYHELVEKKCDKASKELSTRFHKNNRPGDEKFYAEECPLLLMEANEELGQDEKFDAILIDEAQDFKDTWLMSLEDCLKDQDNSLLYVFYDNGQALYSKWNDKVQNMFQFELTENFRNSRPVFDTLKNYYTQSESELEFSGLNDGDMKVVLMSEFKDLRKSTEKLLNTLITTEKLKPEDIVILTGHSPEANVKELLGETLGSHKISYRDRKKGHILVESIRRFKGLESPVVILTDIEDYDLKNHSMFIYTGISRAKMYLYVVGTNEITEKLGLTSNSKQMAA